MPISGADPYLTRIALDTSAYAYLRRGEAQVTDAVASSEVVTVATTVLGELEAGFLRGSRYLDNKSRLTDFLRRPYVSVVDVTQDVAAEYGRIFAQLRVAGTPIPVNDIWIAAAAVTSTCHLVTFDRDFRHIPDLPVTILAN